MSRRRAWQPSLWVVEMRGTYPFTQWRATVGVRLTRGEGRNEQRIWQRRNPTDQFRLRRYVAERS